uniref:Uncharacterized protein n=1 Tax=Candidatus Kentrum sp. MB TaxID=2138164 RepID=A0A450XSA2_9GAMM|nr:MAG: hypothetical protein BECKMB1821I_GA0114274_103016 [Candidatus Kentron sp. MB]VFK74175.1 MAG: hypothetical protein BECKMB1821H_GA0114242_1001106 [Candidatus Kentron sp. MB]
MLRQIRLLVLLVVVMLTLPGCAITGHANEKNLKPFTVSWQFLNARGQLSDECAADPSLKSDDLTGHEIRYGIKTIAKKDEAETLRGRLHVEVYDPGAGKTIARLGGIYKKGDNWEKLTVEAEEKHQDHYALFCDTGDEIAHMPFVILKAGTTQNAQRWKERFDDGWTLRVAQKTLVPENIAETPNRIFTPVQACNTAPPMLPRQWRACPPGVATDSLECRPVMSESKWRDVPSLHFTLPQKDATPKVEYSQYLWDWVKPDLGAKACSVTSKENTPETNLTCRTWSCYPQKMPPPYTLNFGIPFVIDKALKKRLSQSVPGIKNLPDGSHWLHLWVAKKEIMGEYSISDKEWERIVKALNEQAKGKGFNEETPMLPPFKPIEFPEMGTRAQLKPSDVTPYYNLQGADERPPKTIQYCQKTAIKDCDESDWQKANFTSATDKDWAFFTLPDNTLEIPNSPIWIRSAWGDVSEPKIWSLEEVTGGKHSIPPYDSSDKVSGLDRTLDLDNDTPASNKRIFYLSGDWPKDKLTPTEFEPKLRTADGQEIGIREWNSDSFTVSDGSISEDMANDEFTIWFVRQGSQRTAFSARLKIGLSNGTATTRNPKWHYHFLPKKLGDTEVRVKRYGGVKCIDQDTFGWLKGCPLTKNPGTEASLKLDTGQEFKNVPAPPPGQPVDLLEQLRKSPTEVRLFWPEKSRDGKKLVQRQEFPGGTLRIYSPGECPSGNPIEEHKLSSVKIDPDSRLLSIKNPSYSASAALIPLKISPQTAFLIGSKERRSGCLNAEKPNWRLLGKKLVLGIEIPPNSVREIIPLPAGISRQDATWIEPGGCKERTDNGSLECLSNQFGNEHILQGKRDGRIARTFRYQGRNFREAHHYYVELPTARKLEISALAFNSQQDQARSKCQSTPVDGTRTFDCHIITVTAKNQSPPAPKGIMLKDSHGVEAVLTLSNLKPGRLITGEEWEQAMGALPLRWFGAQPLQQRFQGKWQVALWEDSETCDGSLTHYPLDNLQAGLDNAGLRKFSNELSVANIGSLRFRLAPPDSHIATPCAALSLLPIRIKNGEFFLALDLPAPASVAINSGTVTASSGTDDVLPRTIRGRKIVLIDVSPEARNAFDPLLDYLYQWQPDGKTPMDLWLQDMELWGPYSNDDVVNAKAALNEDLQRLVMTPSGLTPFEFLYRPLGSFLGEGRGHHMIAILGAGWADRKWDRTKDGKERFALLRTQMNQGDLDSLTVILLDDGDRPCGRLERNWGKGFDSKFHCKAKTITEALRISGM